MTRADDIRKRAEKAGYASLTPEEQLAWRRATAKRLTSLDAARAVREGRPASPCWVQHVTSALAKGSTLGRPAEYPRCPTCGQTCRDETSRERVRRHENER